MKEQKLQEKRKIYFVSLGTSLGLILLFGLIFFFASDDRSNFLNRYSLSDRVNVSDSDLFSYYFRIANQAYLEGKLEQASKNLSKIAVKKLSPHQEYMYRLLSSCVFRDRQLFYKSLEEIEYAIKIRPTAFAFFLKAKILQDLDKESQMITALTKASEIDPSFRAAYEKLGDFFFSKGDLTKARDYYKQAEQSSIPLASINIKMALIDFYYGLYENSISRLEGLGGVEKNRYLPFIYFLIGMNQYSLKNFEEYDKSLERAVGSSATDERVAYLYYWAKLSNERNDFQKAISLFKQALIIAGDDHPFSANLLMDLSHVSFRQGEYAQAIKYIQKIYDKNPKLLNDTFYYQMGVSYYKLGEYNNAQRFLKWVVDNSNDDDLLKSSTYLLAQSYYKDNDLSKARSTLASFSESWGRTPLIIYAMMELEIVENQDSFLELYKRYIDDDGGEKKYDLLLAKYFVEIGDFSSAIGIYSDYIRKKPSAKNFFLIADLYRRIKEYDLSVYYYDRALLETGSSEERAKILNNKANVLIQEGRVDEASKILLSLASSDRSPVIYWYNLALLALSRNEGTKYSEMIQKSYLYLNGNEDKKLQASIHLHYALIKARLYNFKLARRLINKAYSLDPDNEKISFYYHKGFKDYISHF